MVSGNEGGRPRSRGGTALRIGYFFSMREYPNPAPKAIPKEIHNPIFSVTAPITTPIINPAVM